MVGPNKSGTISATGQVNLGPAALKRVSSWLIQFQASTSPAWSGSITIKGAATDTANTVIALGYKGMDTSAVETAAITTNDLVLVDSSGVDVQLDCTSYTTGSMAYTAVPLLG